MSALSSSSPTPHAWGRPAKEHAADDSLSEFRRDVLAGLGVPHRSLPCKYFYDATGSQLFDAICDLDQYYPTRSELEIMRLHAAEMAEHLGPEICLIEYGSGSSVKTRLLLDHLIDPEAYVPVDISESHLQQASAGIALEYPLIRVEPVVADFTKPLSLRASQKHLTCVYFPGSTIGNFSDEQAHGLLASIAQTVHRHGGLLIGIDLEKDVDILEQAYNDREGVTATFNLNLLRRINDELGGDFDLSQFAHQARYDAAAHRIEMRLRSLVDQTVRIDDHTFDFRRGETILTEYSHKYSIDSFTSLARSSGWTLRQAWTDAQAYFAVLYLQTR